MNKTKKKPTKENASKQKLIGKINVSYGNTGNISVGDYESQRRFYNISVEVNCDSDKFDISVPQRIMDEIKPLLDSKVARDFSDLHKTPTQEYTRFSEIDGVKYPHVTDIISLGVTPKIPHIKEHAYHGTFLDRAIKNYIDTGILAVPEGFETQETPNIKKTTHDLLIDAGKKLKELKDVLHFNGHTLAGVNHTHRYIGEMDAWGVYKGKKVLIDIKKTKSITGDILEKYLMQVSAYANFESVSNGKADGFTYEGALIFSPYCEPIFIDMKQISEYFKKFLEKREQFKQKFGM